MTTGRTESEPVAIPVDDLSDLCRHTTVPGDVANLLDKTFVNALPTPLTGDPSITPLHTLSTATGKRFGRYEVIQKLGEGGMGAVFLARDTATGESVALKVLSDECLRNPDSFQRFEKEARLLEEAQNPHIANMLDLGTEGTTRFLVMEYVDGGDLRKWMSKRGAVDETTALDIMGDLCRALTTVHSRGMVHRDIKPENVLISEVAGATRPSIKLTDFGLARHIDQTESLKLTKTGALLGTPYYMAPEQFRGAGDVSPATDVYALGITLFELLAGQRPFTADNPIKLAAAHCFDSPPDLSKLATNISESVAELVKRTLAKQPGERPCDAGALLEEILRVQSGRAGQVDLHPMLPDHDPTRVLTADFEWTLNSPPETLWRYVSNTDRFNQAAGIPPVTYEMTIDEQGRSHKFGQFRMAGMTMRWEEHPFEWVEGHRFSILREFPTGPFVWFLSRVELVARVEGGTLLKHHVTIEPRGIAGRMIANLEVGIKGKRNLDRIYRRIDSTLTGVVRHGLVTDPFQRPSGLSRVQRSRLGRQLNQLQVIGVNESVITILQDFIANSAPQDLARIRPYALARQFGLAENDVVEACLYAVQHGILTLFWDIICPSCRMATDARQTLRDIEQHGNCSACQTDFKVEFGSSLEMVFRVHPEIRTADARTYCNGGPGNFPHVVAQVTLEPGERLVLNLDLEAGSYQLRGPRLPYAVPIEVDARQGARHASIRCNPAASRQIVGTLFAGQQQLTLENSFPDKQLVRVERIIRRSESITAAQATALPLFRQLFPQETLTPGQMVQLATTNFLAIQLDSFDRLFSERGDVAAYEILKDFEQLIERYTQARGGSVIDGHQGQLLICFSDPVVAIEAARGLPDALSGQIPNVQHSIAGALHRGAALVTTNRQQTRYFGATVNAVVRLAQLAPPGKLLLTEEICRDPGVEVALGKASILETRDTTGVLREIDLNVTQAIESALPIFTQG